MKATPSRHWIRRARLGLVFLLLFGFASGSAKIGALLGKSREDGRLYVRSLPPEQSAARAGLQAGDEVVAIDGKDVRPMTTEQVSEALRGKPGSTVVLTVQRDGLRRDVTIERAE